MPKNSKKRLKIAIICGGPSAERGISLNSARSLYDNLDQSKYDLTLLYVNPKLKFFKISTEQIYSNTPLDFDFRLQNGKKALSSSQLQKMLKSMYLAFPAIHGTFGEDGQLQDMLEKAGVRYTGSGPRACGLTSDKYLCQKVLKENNFYVLEGHVVNKGEPLPKLKPGKYVAKPLHGGSSIGVQYISDLKDLETKLNEVFKVESAALIEPECNGKEFTIIVLENAIREPVALMPTEIEMKKDQFFDYRKKYLATAETRYHTPARFDEKTVQYIRKEACRAFKCLSMKDFGRLDGWILSDGTIWFSDVNAISGMEQNSFLFQQAALLGLSHPQLLDFIINKKIKKTDEILGPDREEIPVVFGGNTAERQISVMSGTNVWMKLKSSRKYKPVPFFLSFEQKFYHIPQFLCLQHTVEEIEEKIKQLNDKNFLEKLIASQEIILKELGIEKGEIDEPLFVPIETDLEELKKKYRFLFLGLHGGAGENGTFQKMLDHLRLPYNGPGAACSALCMDKFLTGKITEKARIPGISTAKKTLVGIQDNPEKIWQKLQDMRFSNNIILKPRGDGCSAGVIRISSIEQLKKALEYFQSGNPCIPEKAIHAGHGQIDLPSKRLDEILIEDFIVTDKVDLENLKINWKTRSDIIEITVGFLGLKNKLTVMYPSQTISSLETLSLEEKFMGGTGINLVPPPSPYVKPAIIKKVQKRLKKIAQALGIEGYTRMDCFMNRKTGDLIIIEANTLPALTPSTTFFQQGLKMKKPLAPRQLLEKIIEIGKERFSKK